METDALRFHYTFSREERTRGRGRRPLGLPVRAIIRAGTQVPNGPCIPAFVRGGSPSEQPAFLVFLYASHVSCALSYCDGGVRRGGIEAGDLGVADRNVRLPSGDQRLFCEVVDSCRRVNPKIKRLDVLFPLILGELSDEVSPKLGRTNG